MLFRNAFPDETARARSFVGSRDLPEDVRFLLALEEHPVERIESAMPFWFRQEGESEETQGTVCYFGFLSSSPPGKDGSFGTLIGMLEKAARKEGALFLKFAIGIPDIHPLLPDLFLAGFEKGDWERYFSIPAAPMGERAARIFAHTGHKIPENWTLAPLKGHNAASVFRLVNAHRLMREKTFHTLWNLAGTEVFSPRYSRILLEKGGKIIGIFLVSERPGEELHVHVEAAAPERMAVSPLISTMLKHDVFTRFATDHPSGRLTLRADSSRHRQSANAALRFGGVEQTSQAFFSKELSPG